MVLEFHPNLTVALPAALTGAVLGLAFGPESQSGRRAEAEMVYAPGQPHIAH